MLFLVIAYDRPKYLDVTLESIYRIHGIEKYPVMVSVDGGGKHRQEVLEVLKKYPLDGWVMHRYNQRIVKHITFSVANMMQWGYDEVLYLEEDLIVKPDVLEYLENAPRDAFFISLSVHPNVCRVLRKVYQPLGNMVRSDCFFQLVDYVKSGGYIGTDSGVNAKRAFYANYPWHHPVYATFARCYNKLSRSPPVQCVQHFGVMGAHFPRKYGGKAIEEEMFAGPREGWLGNILKLAQTGNHPAFQTERKFSYGEEL